MSFSKKVSVTGGTEPTILDSTNPPPPGSISTTFSVEHGPPPKSIFDNGGTPVTAPTKDLNFTLPPPEKKPEKDAPRTINREEKLGNQVGITAPSHPRDVDVSSVSQAKHEPACGAMCSTMISVGAVGLVAMVGVFAVVAYRRRARTTRDIERYDPGPYRDSSDLARMSGVRTDEEVEKERVRALELLTARKLAHAELVKKSMLDIE